jgi:hypothetical protein
MMVRDVTAFSDSQVTKCNLAREICHIHTPEGVGIEIGGASDKQC